MTKIVCAIQNTLKVKSGEVMNAYGESSMTCRENSLIKSKTVSNESLLEWRENVVYGF